MLRRMILGTTLLAFLASPPPAWGQEDPGMVDALREGLENRQARFLAAMADRNAEEVAGFFAEDAVLQVANRPPVRGRKAIERFYGNVFGFLTSSTAEPGVLELSGSGDLAWGEGQTTNAFRGPDGPLEYTGKYLAVWRHAEGEWFLAAYSVSSDDGGGGG